MRRLLRFALLGALLCFGIFSQTGDATPIGPEVVCSWETETCTSTVYQTATEWVLTIICADPETGEITDAEIYTGTGTWPGFCPE